MRPETDFKPKPMVLVGGKPILWHIMKTYAYYGFNEFVLALGYKGNMIKDYFLHEHAYVSDFTLDTKTKKVDFLRDGGDNFKITFVDTGEDSLTGERMLKCRDYITEDEVMVTYGDGVSNIPIPKLIEFHRSQGTISTVTGIHPHSKFGLFTIDENKSLATSFEQKPFLKSSHVNGGFMIFKKEFFDYLDESPIENQFSKLIEKNQLSVYKHDGFWQAVDTQKELELINERWEENKPWAVWEK